MQTQIHLYFEHTQVIEETLRTHCPVRGPFKESPVGGVNLSGCNVPGGTMIFVSITALNTVGVFAYLYAMCVRL